MNDESFLIQFIPSNNSFLQFSNKWFKKVNSPKWPCLKLEQAGTRKTFRMTCAPQPNLSLSDCVIGINATCAQGLRLSEGDLVVVSTEDSITPLRQVHLTPASNDDYEILELSRDIVEVSLLDQIRVVNVCQDLSIWLSRTVQLRLTVDKLEPEAMCGRLDQMTELVIQQFSSIVPGKHEPSKRNVDSHASSFSQEPTHHSEQASLWQLLSDYLPSTLSEIFSSSKNSRGSVSNNSTECRDDSQLILRVHPYPKHSSNKDCCGNQHNEMLHPFNVFVRKRMLQKEVSDGPHRNFINDLYKEQVCLCNIKYVTRQAKPSEEAKGGEKNGAGSAGENINQRVVVCVHLINEECHFWKNKSNVPSACISQFLRKLLDLEIGSYVKFSSYSPNISINLLEIRLTSASKMKTAEEAEQLCELFTARLPPGEGLLVNQDCPLPLPRPNGFAVVKVQLHPRDLRCWPLTRAELEVCPVTVESAEDPSLELLAAKPDNSFVPPKNSVFNQLVEEGVATLEFGLRLTQAENQNLLSDNILITGMPGSGKSRLAEAICSAVSGPPHHVHIRVLNCRTLKGKKAETLAKLVGERLEECVRYQPSVLLLEDLQSIAEAPAQGIEPFQQDFNCLKFVSSLRDLLSKLFVGQRVVIMATAESKNQLHPQLLSPRGRHSFTTVLDIHALDKKEREQILVELFGGRLESGVGLKGVAERTEGCVARDLCRLADKGFFYAFQRPDQGSEVRVSESDLEEALRGFMPIELMHNPASRHENPTLTFASVGGLRQAKQTLTETIIWPTKYKEVFNDCPLRLERGVLLYGAPGTGKTMLAAALAGESKLNSITVKGPELLSKYIGASEEAVRNVFQRAQCAKPCILFFDEFDSLAPRRGHDSTGVTDRVVNQLLTALDGVEALDGVWVVAAASRPDLLDPALLRPGRVGTLVRCPLPNQDERLEILQCLSERLQLFSDVDLAQVAASTEGFTGADLQALLFTAQIIAYDSLQAFECVLKIDQAQAKPLQVEVCQKHLDMALNQTSPSLKPNDRLKFQFIYDQFQNRTESTGQFSSREPGLRVTLA